MTNSEESTSKEVQKCEISEKIIMLAQANPKGISDKDITMHLPDLLPSNRVAIINKLLQQGFFDLFNQNSILIYR